MQHNHQVKNILYIRAMPGNQCWSNMKQTDLVYKPNNDDQFVHAICQAFSSISLPVIVMRWNSFLQNSMLFLVLVNQK